MARGWLPTIGRHLTPVALHVGITDVRAVLSVMLSDHLCDCIALPTGDGRVAEEKLEIS